MRWSSVLMFYDNLCTVVSWSRMDRHTDRQCSSAICPHPNRPDQKAGHKTPLLKCLLYCLLFCLSLHMPSVIVWCDCMVDVMSTLPSRSRRSRSDAVVALYHVQVAWDRLAAPHNSMICTNNAREHLLKVIPWSVNVHETMPLGRIPIGLSNYSKEAGSKNDSAVFSTHVLGMLSFYSIS